MPRDGLLKMFEIISIISSWALKFIDQTGYLGVFLLSALESAAIPIPSEVVVPFSGFLAAQGRFNFWIVVLVATFANLIGSIILYWISYFGGRRLIESYGKYILVSAHEIRHADELFAKHGSLVIFIGRILPVIRTFISIPAGVAKMNFGKFMGYTFLGSLPWNFALALIGFKAGENWDILSPYFHKFDFAIMAVGLVFIIWYILRHFKHKHIIHG